MLLRLHRTVFATSGYVLLAASAFAWALLTIRIRESGANNYLFLNWNLFLAWIPYACAVAVPLFHNRAIRWILGLTWLFFFPNAPYLITDFVHFRYNYNFAWWYDVGMLATFSCIGLFLALVSLRILQLLIDDSWAKKLSWPFVVGVSLLSGFGVYLGRFIRLNSWDLVTNPTRILRDLQGILSSPELYPRAAGMTLLFTGLFLFCYVTYVQAAFVAQRLSHVQD